MTDLKANFKENTNPMCAACRKEIETTEHVIQSVKSRTLTGHNITQASDLAEIKRSDEAIRQREAIGWSEAIGKSKAIGQIDILSDRADHAIGQSEHEAIRRMDMKRSDRAEAIRRRRSDLAEQK